MRAAAVAVAIAASLVPATARATSDITTAVDVGPLVVGTFSVPAATVQPRLPDGFAARSCFGGTEADVAVLVTEETYADLPRVPSQPVRVVTVMTCVTPPDWLTRADATEPHFFVLGQWSDSQPLRTFVHRRGGVLDEATIAIDPLPGGYALDARFPDGTVLFAGTVATPDVPTPPLADCAEHATRGRVLSDSRQGFGALDFEKDETVCLGAGSFRWDAASPLTTLVGASGRAGIAAHTRVDSARYTFRTFAVDES